MSDKPIAVITYDYPHRKTQDVIFGLKARGYRNVVLCALPFVKRKNAFQPIYTHRPTEALDVYPEELADNFDYIFHRVQVEELESIFNKVQPKAILIAGAGLLPPSLVQKHHIINSHPAYLPEVRGLDALKWAIHYKRKIGVTTHFIDENADAGRLIDRQEVPVYSHDTFHALAFRQYRLEIYMLIKAIVQVEHNGSFSELEEKGEVHRRMPKKIEKDLLNDFEKYKTAFAIS